MNRAKKIDLNLIEKAECYRCKHYGGNYLESGFNCSIHPFGPQSVISQQSRIITVSVMGHFYF